LTSYTYSHPEGKGFGQHHAEAAGRELPAEMRDLDMASGTIAEQVGTDEDTGAVILAWTDSSGITRHTAVQPDFLAANFTTGAPALAQDGEAV
jgi:hypothetical protein